MKTLREKIEIMEAFERGEKIQSFFIFNNSKYWEDAENPVWDWHFYDYRVKTGEKMTQREFNLIKERLTDWRNERGLTYENQREEFLGNVYEELSEYFRAKDDLERVDAVCDIVIFCFNSFDLEFKEIGKIYDCDATKISIVDIADDLTYTTAKFMRKDFKDFNNIYRLVFNCEHLCKNLGFDFYKCMLEKIKEIESRTGFYDERLKKFVDKICAFSKDEALSNVSKDFGFLGNSIIYKLTQEDKNFWFITCKEIETNLQIDYKVKKIYKADYESCRLEK